MTTTQTPVPPARYVTAIGLGATLLAVMVLNVVFGDTGRSWANAILLPSALIVASGVLLITRGRGYAFLGYLVFCAGLIVSAVGTLLIAARMTWGWPLLITLPSLAVAGTYLWRPAHPVARALHRGVAGLALLAASLGPVFLIGPDTLGWSDRWWAAYMVGAGVVILGNALEITRHEIQYRFQGATLLAGPAIITILLGFRFLTGALP